MDPDQIQILQQSLRLVELKAARAASLFCARLFKVAPSLRPLFENDLEWQRKTLIVSMRLILTGVDSPDRLIMTVRSMGKRHADDGVQAEHYVLGGEALLWTLERSLGAAYTPEVATAWASAYALLIRLMQEAADEATQTGTYHPGYV